MLLAFAGLYLRLLLTLSLLLAALRMAGARAARLPAQIGAVRQQQLTSLLLRDFGGRSADLLWRLDADGRLVEVSPALADALGQPLSPRCAMGLAQALAALCPGGPTAAAHQQAVRQALAEGRAFRDLQVPVLRLARQGQPAGLRWWSIMAKPWADRDGQPLGWIGVIADVTEARQAEQLLLRKADFDGLTGLANRGQLMQRLGSILRSDESATPRRCALLLLDLSTTSRPSTTAGAMRRATPS